MGKWIYYVKCGGQFVCEADSYEHALYLINKFEMEDIRNNQFEEGAYEVGEHYEN